MKVFVIDYGFYLSYELIDFYYCYKEDIKLMVEMGFKCFCMFISWLCIFLNGDEMILNEKGLVFYDVVFDECYKYGIELVVIINYFDILLEVFKKYGGWKNCKCIDFYLNFCEVIFMCYKDKVKYWMIFNEINMIFYFLYIGGGLDVIKEDNLEEVKY